MEEVEIDSKWIRENGTNVPSADAETTGPTLLEQQVEGQAVIITLLMRLYDIQMASLSFINKEVADELYDAHARGESSNPQIYIPVRVEE